MLPKYYLDCFYYLKGISYDFNYVSPTTDAYSKKIVGFHLYPYLTIEGCLQGLIDGLKEQIVSK